MRRIIDGYKYDTEISNKLCSIKVSDTKTIVVYANKNGAFFGHIIDVLKDEVVNEQLIPYSKKETLDLIAGSDEGIENYEKLYGTIAEAPADEDKPTASPVSPSINETAKAVTIPDIEDISEESLPPPKKEVNYQNKADKSFKMPIFKQKALVKYSMAGEEKKVFELLQAGVEPSQKAFHKAFAYKRHKIIELLLEGGYMPTAKDIEYAILLGETDLFMLIVPMENSLPLKELQDCMYLAAVYNKHQIMDYLNDIITKRKESR